LLRTSGVAGMRQISAENFTALQDRRLVARDFIWFVVRDRTTGEAVTDGYWSGAGFLTTQVIDPATGGVATRSFMGAGTLIQISDIPLVSNITVQNVTIKLNQVADHVNDLIRGYDCKQGQVQIWRGLFDPDSRQLVSPAPPRFFGFIDQIEILTPSENSEGGVTLTCTSHTQEMTRYNPDTRSDASQRLRAANDNFYQDTATIGTAQFFWGRANGTVQTSFNKKFG
jgi:hypothetical protein